MKVKNLENAKISFEKGLKYFQQEKFDVSDIPYPEKYEGLYKERRYDCGKQLYES